MSCQKNANVVNRFACRASGIAEQASTSAYHTAQRLNSVTMVMMQIVNQGSVEVTKSATLNQLVNRLPPVVALRTLNCIRQRLERFSPINKVARTVGKVTGLIGTISAEFSRQGSAGTVRLDQKVLGIKVGEQQVPLWHSSLTPLLNRRNRLGIGETVTTETGLLAKGQGVTWHRGTTTIALPKGGGQRTVTQVQSLSYPASYYYFDRPLSHPETAALVSGQIKPEKMRGFVGQTSPVESLRPGYAALKGHYFRAKIYGKGETD